MSDLNVDFDLGEVSGFQSIAPGKYRAIVTEVQLKPGYGDDGNTLWVKLQLLDGEYKNRFITAFIDTHNSVDWKQTKGRMMLKSLANSLEIETLTNFGQLVTTAPVGIEVKNYKSRSGDIKESVNSFFSADNVPVVEEGGDSGLAF
jgi:hypothetical protein